MNLNCVVDPFHFDVDPLREIVDTKSKKISTIIFFLRAHYSYTYIKQKNSYYYYYPSNFNIILELDNLLTTLMK